MLVCCVARVSVALLLHHNVISYSYTAHAMIEKSERARVAFPESAKLSCCEKHKLNFDRFSYEIEFVRVEMHWPCHIDTTKGMIKGKEQKIVHNPNNIALKFHRLFYSHNGCAVLVASIAPYSSELTQKTRNSASICSCIDRYSFRCRMNITIKVVPLHNETRDCETE